jgi:hypothetical protein
VNAHVFLRPNISIKIVSGIYAIWSIYSIVYVLPLLTGVFLPSFTFYLFYPFFPSLFVLWFDLIIYLPMSLGFLLYGEAVIGVFYPVASYYLLRKSKKTWISAIAASLLTVACNLYVLVVRFVLEDTLPPLLFAGIPVNVIILVLLWHSRGNYQESIDQH